MNDPNLGRAVLELATEGDAFFADLDKLEKVAKLIGTAFEASGQKVKSFGSHTRSAAQEASFLDRALSSAVGSFSGFISAQAVMSAVGRGFDFAKTAVIGMNSTLETTTLQFGTLMGSSDKAKDHVKDLFDIAKKTPFETGPIIEASRMLRTFGGDALNTKKNILMIGDAAAATGAPINELGFWVGRLYSNIKGGQPFGEAAMRLQELAVMSPQVRAQMEAMQKAGKSADEIFAIFSKDLEKFSGSMEKQAATWEGVTSTFTDTVNLTLASAFQPLFETIRDGIGALNDFLGSPEAEAFVAWVGQEVAGAVDTTKQALRDLWTELEAHNAFEKVAASVKIALESIKTDTPTLNEDLGFLLRLIAGKGEGESAGFTDLAIQAVTDRILQQAAAWHLLGLAVREAKLAAMAAVPAALGAGSESGDWVLAASMPKTPAAPAMFQGVGGASGPTSPYDEHLVQGYTAAETIARKLTTAEKQQQRAVDAIRGALKGLTQDEKDLVDVTMGLSDGMTKTGVTADQVAKAYGLSAEAVRAYIAELKDGEKFDDAFQKATLETAAKINKAWNEVMAKTSARLSEAFSENAAIAKSAAKDWTSAVEANEADSLEKRLGIIHREMDERRAALDKNASNYRETLALIDALEQETARAATTAWEDHVAELKRTLPTVGNLFRQVLGGIPDLLTSALTGGGGFAGAGKAIVSNLGSGLGGMLFSGKVGQGIAQGVLNGFGMKAATAIGSFLPGIGALIGGLIGPLFGKLFGPTKTQQAGRDADKQADAIKQQLIDQYGSLEAIRTMGGGAGEALYQAFARRGVDGLKLVNEALAKFKTNLNIQSEIDTLQGQLDSLKESLVPTADQVKTVMDRYGMTLDKMGPQIQQLFTNNSAKGLLEDFQLLERAGMDGAAAAKGMSKELNQLVVDSMTMGTSIPSNLRPVLQYLVDMGLLTDKDGKKLTDLGGLNWGDAVETEADKTNKAMQALIEKIQALIDKLNGLDGKTVTTTVVVDTQEGRRKKYEGDDYEAEPYHTGGIVHRAMRAHRGMFIGPAALAADEVPIIAQTGEEVIDRPTASLAKWAAGQLRGGQSGAGDAMATAVSELAAAVAAARPKTVQVIIPAGTATDQEMVERRILPAINRAMDSDAYGTAHDLVRLLTPRLKTALAK